MLCVGHLSPNSCRRTIDICCQACFITHYVSLTTRDLTSSSLAWKRLTFASSSPTRTCHLGLHRPCESRAEKCGVHDPSMISHLSIKMLRRVLRPDTYAAFALTSVISLTSSAYSRCEWASTALSFQRGDSWRPHLSNSNLSITIYDTVVYSKPFPSRCRAIGYVVTPQPHPSIHHFP